MSYQKLRVGPVPRSLPGIPPVLAAGIVVILITVLAAAGFAISHPANQAPAVPVPRDRVVFVHLQLPTASAPTGGGVV